MRLETELGAPWLFAWLLGIFFSSPTGPRPQRNLSVAAPQSQPLPAPETSAQDFPYG